ncbi:hypothetical protein BDA96_10G160000, partial [Sorghum bicolor]
SCSRRRPAARPAARPCRPLSPLATPAGCPHHRPLPPSNLYFAPSPRRTATMQPAQTRQLDTRVPKAGHSQGRRRHRSTRASTSAAAVASMSTPSGNGNGGGASSSSALYDLYGPNAKPDVIFKEAALNTTLNLTFRV